MRALLQAFVDGIREDLGQPVSLMRLLAQQPRIHYALEPPSPSIALGSIVKWHRFAESSALSWPRRGQGRLMGWRSTGGHYANFDLCRPELEEIGRCETIEDWSCDITEVYGFSASKSNLCQFASMDQMVEANSREMIDEITHEKLDRNLRHGEIRIIHRKNRDYFVRHLWDDRVFLMNSGGSHHFAAAKYIASRLRQPVKLRGRLDVYSLSSRAVASLRADFEMFVISDEADVSLGFYDAMRNFGATWLWHCLPAPYAAAAKVILLPRSEDRSMRVAALLRQAGIVDFGEYLSGLVARQTWH